MTTGITSGLKCSGTVQVPAAAVLGCWRWLRAPLSPHKIGRIGWIDALRAIVCISVVLFHLGLPEPLSRVPVFNGTYSLFVTFRPGMECFMVLSGFMLGHLLRPRGDGPFSAVSFLSGRFVRLAIPFWVATTCAIALCWVEISLGSKRPPLSAGDAVANYLFVTDLLSTKWPDLFHWSLIALFHATVFWLGVYWVVRRLVIAHGLPKPHRRANEILTGMAIALAALGGWYLVEVRSLRGWQMPYVLAQMTAGWLTYRVVVGEAGRWVIAYIAGILVVVTDLTGQYRLTVWMGATVAFLLVAGRAGDERLPSRLRWLEPLGQISFSVYLTHGLVGNRLFILAKALTGSPSAEVAFGLYVASLVLIFIVAAIFHRCVERTIGEVMGWLPHRMRGPLPTQPEGITTQVRTSPPAGATAGFETAVVFPSIQTHTNAGA